MTKVNAPHNINKKKIKSRSLCLFVLSIVFLRACVDVLVDMLLGVEKEEKKKGERKRGKERKGLDWIGWVDAWYDYTKSTEKEEDSRGAIGNASFLSACLGLSRSFFFLAGGKK